MNDLERGDLQNPDNWDSKNIERHTGARARRTIVSVGFSRPDFEKVAKLAEQLGLNVSTFIRDATLEKVTKLTVQTRSGPMTLEGPFTTAMEAAPSTTVRWVNNTFTDTGLMPPDRAHTEVLPPQILIPAS
jgi:hypothetical protein